MEAQDSDSLDYTLRQKGKRVSRRKPDDRKSPSPSRTRLRDEAHKMKKKPTHHTEKDEEYPNYYPAYTNDTLDFSKKTRNKQDHLIDQDMISSPNFSKHTKKWWI